MPRKRRIEDDIETETKVIDIDPQDLKVRRIMQSMPGGLKCLQLFRYSAGNKGGRPTYIDDISPEQFDFKAIKSMFGGGKFQVKWDNEDGSLSKADFDIAGPVIDFDTPLGVEQPEPKETYPQQNYPQPVQVVPQVQQGFDPMTMLKMMQDARKEAREEMRDMMAMMRPAQQSPDVTKQVFEIVEKIAPMMAGDGGSPWMAALSQFREPIMKIVDSIHQAVSRPAAMPSGPPPHVHAQVQPNPPQPETEDDMLKILIRQYVPMFVNAARTNGNPDLYADMILEQIPQSMYPKLEAWLSTPAWFEDIVKIEKNVQFQAGWWNLLRASILEGLKPDASSDVQSATDSELSED